jgi:hypothetical protein
MHRLGITKPSVDPAVPIEFSMRVGQPPEALQTHAHFPALCRST